MLKRIANLLAPHEPVTVGFASKSSPAAAFEFHPEVSFLKLEYDDIWVRDTGPIVLTRKDRTPVALDFKFNSWGGLFNQSSLDDALAGKIAAVEKIEILRSDLVLEGGAILTDGAGTIFVTEESVLNYNRNPGMKRDDAELVFRKFLNAKQTIWLPRGLAHDESGGHGIACIGYRRSNASEFLTRKGFVIEAGHELSRRNQSGSRARVPQAADRGYGLEIVNNRSVCGKHAGSVVDEPLTNRAASGHVLRRASRSVQPRLFHRELRRSGRG
jgi:Porphyromonas-type peptidyl-arginine deiminase